MNEKKIIQEEVDVIQKQMEELDKSKNFVVYDGIVDLKKYNNSKIKILWILKNPHSDGSDTDNWSICNCLKRVDKWEHKGGENTFKHMALTSHAILNDELISSDHYKKWNEYFKSMHNIAYINVRKHLGKSSSYSSVITSAYKKNKQLLHNQIKTYNPDVIIFGNTFSKFKKELQKEDIKSRNRWKWKHLKFKNRGFYIQNEVLYIDTYHPELRTLKGKDKIEYSNSILNAVREWKKLKSK